MEEILETCEKLTSMGVPFVVPFVPVSGTSFESHPPPSPDFMKAVLEPLAEMILRSGMSSDDQSWMRKMWSLFGAIRLRKDQDFK